MGNGCLQRELWELPGDFLQHIPENCEDLGSSWQPKPAGQPFSMCSSSVSTYIYMFSGQKLSSDSKHWHPSWTLAAVHLFSVRGISEALQYCNGVQSVWNAGSQFWSSAVVTHTVSGPCPHISKIPFMAFDEHNLVNKASIYFGSRVSQSWLVANPSPTPQLL